MALFNKTWLTFLKVHTHLCLFRLQKMFSAEKRSRLIKAEEANTLESSIDWLVNYIGKPHNQLGREGDICPFVRTALKRNKMDFRIYPAITHASRRTISNIFMAEALKLLKSLNPSDREMELTTINILFPNLSKENAPVVHDAHTYCKSFLMSQGVMVAVFYEGYDKRGIYNPEFALYQSPFPIATIRPMALHDIIFLEYNEEGFREYWGRYKNRYQQKKVPEKYGYYERFHAAEARFEIRGRRD